MKSWYVSNKKADFNAIAAKYGICPYYTEQGYNRRQADKYVFKRQTGGYERSASYEGYG